MMAAKAKRTKARGDARADAELRLEGLEVEVEEVLVPVEELVLLADVLLLEPVVVVELEAVAEELDEDVVVVLPDELDPVEVELPLEVEDAEDEEAEEEAAPARVNCML
jgi:hypothetical protein